VIQAAKLPVSQKYLKKRKNGYRALAVDAMPQLSTSGKDVALWGSSANA
jgi:hypothetical protein